MAMGVEARLVLFAPDEPAARAAAQKAIDRLGRLDRVMSDYKLDSELMQLCAEPPGQWKQVSSDLWNVLCVSQKLAVASGGAFDITSGPITHLWRKARRDRRLPEEQEISAALARVGWAQLELDDALPRARLLAPDMQLDLGGIGKGYAVDDAARALREVGISRHLVALAGDIALGDAPPGQEGWTVTLDPGWPGGAKQIMCLTNVGVSTSGEAMQFLEIGGVTYSHIIDPRTGRPIEGHRAVAVIAPTATASDGLATTLNVMTDDGLVTHLLRAYGARGYVQEPEDHQWREIAR